MAYDFEKHGEKVAKWAANEPTLPAWHCSVGTGIIELQFDQNRDLWVRPSSGGLLEPDEAREMAKFILETLGDE